MCLLTINIVEQRNNATAFVMFLSHWKNKNCKLEAAYLHQGIHQSLSFSQSLVWADRAIIAHFVIYKWHEDDLSRVSDSATAGKILAQRPFTSLAAPAPLPPLEAASFKDWGSRWTRSQSYMMIFHIPLQWLNCCYRFKTCSISWQMSLKEPAVGKSK